MAKTLSLASAFVIVGAFIGTTNVLNAASVPTWRPSCTVLSEGLQCNIVNASIRRVQAVEFTITLERHKGQKPVTTKQVALAVDALHPRAPLSVTLPIPHSVLANASAVEVTATPVTPPLLKREANIASC